jgi:hypothetical protein
MAGLFAKGTGLYVGDGASPQVFTKILNLKSITGPEVDVTIVDTTTHSTVGNWREKAAVLINGGAVSFSANFDPDDPTLDPNASDTVWDNLVNLRSRDYQLRLSPANTNQQMMVFSGFVTKHGFTFPVDNVQEAAISIETDGPITWDFWT